MRTVLDRIETDDGVTGALGQFNIDEDSGTVTALVSLDREGVGDFLQFHVVAVIAGYQSPSHALVLVTGRRCPASTTQQHALVVRPSSTTWLHHPGGRPGSTPW